MTLHLSICWLTCTLHSVSQIDRQGGYGRIQTINPKTLQPDSLLLLAVDVEVFVALLVVDSAVIS